MIKLKYKPTRGPIVISSKFGIRELSGFEFHPGLDIKASLGDSIYCVADGKVAVTWNDPDGYGQYVVVEHDNYCTLYAHLREQILTTGKSIKAGELIGYVGMTGVTTGPHLHFEIRDCLYSNSNFWLKSNLKGRHVMCIDPEDIIKEANNIPESTVRYKKYTENIHELRADAGQLAVTVVDKTIWNITEFTNCVNGTFYWYDTKGSTYATSPLVIDGTVYQRYCNHGKPQSVFIVYKDGTVALQKVIDVYQVQDFYNAKLIIGGIGLRNTLDSSFKYDPAGEGFSGVYSDVLRKTNKTVIGYNKNLNKVYLLAVRNVTHGELIKIISDNSSGEAYDIAVSLDGGGSTFMDANKQYVFQGEKNRHIHNVIRFI